MPFYLWRMLKMYLQKVISIKTQRKKIFLLASWSLLKKRAGAGSVSQRYQNVTDPGHWKKKKKMSWTHLAGGGEDRVEPPVGGDVEHLPRLVVRGEGDTLQQRLQPLLTLQQRFHWSVALNLDQSKNKRYEKKELAKWSWCCTLMRIRKFFFHQRFRKSIKKSK